MLDRAAIGQGRQGRRAPRVPALASVRLLEAVLRQLRALRHASPRTGRRTVAGIILGIVRHLHEPDVCAGISRHRRR